jgi:sugar lactone lactonase YvrE
MPIVALAVLFVGCTPEPERPEPEPHACEVDPTGLVCTVAGTGLRGAGADDLPALETDLFLPISVSFTPDGRPLIVDFNNHRIRVLEDDGVLVTLAGNGVHAYALDGVDARDSGLENPIAAVMGLDGALFIQELHGARILRVDPVTNVIETYVGSAESPGYPGYEGDGGPATEASMSEAAGLAIADDGTLYFADAGNHCIRKVTPPDGSGGGGIIDTVAGDGVPGLADGVGREARFDVPMDVEWVPGALYVVESANSTLRHIDLATGEVTTLAGNGDSGFTGDGGPAVDAQLAAPRGLGVGPDGAVYVADSDNHVVRRYDPADGTLVTVVGKPGELHDATPEGPYDGDGVAPQDVLLNWPNDVMVSAGGDLYVMDTLTDRLRRVFLSGD